MPPPVGNTGGSNAQPGGSGNGGGSGGTGSVLPGGGSGGTGVGGSGNPQGGQPPTNGGSGGTGVGGTAGGAPPVGGTSGGDTDPPPPRAIDIQGTDTFNESFNGQSMFLNKSKTPVRGKLVLLLGGICTGTGAGGFESFVKQYGFHVFAPKTDTCVNSAPEQYKTAIKANPMDMEANRQVADARMELWDGKDRVDWVTVGAGQSILEQTIAAIKFGDEQDPGSDWGYFLNADGTLRTSDVYVIGYSWGAQAWAMMSSYVRFGRVIATSGPASEGFPNAEWITHPAATATPAERKFMLVGLKAAYPSADNGDSGDMEKFTNVLKAGWVGPPVNYMPGSGAAVTAGQNVFAMIGSNNASPGGHTVFCNDNPSNGWLPVCKHVLGIE
jgi:hypothetical protein